MPASRRHHRALAVIVNCLGILAAVPALPTTAPATRAAAATPAPEASTSPAPAAAATPQGHAGAAGPPGAHAGAAGPPGAHAAPAAPGVAATGAVIPVTPAAPAPGMATTANPGAPRPAPPITVAVAPAATPVPGYRILIRNSAATTVITTVRQELPPGSSTTAVSAGGLATRQNGTGEVTWRLTVPARSSRTLDTALAATAPGRALTAPACAFTSDGNRPYDCATATWQAAPATPEAQVTPAPPWRRPPVLAAALAALLVLAAGGLWWWQRARRRRGGVEPTGTAPAAAGQPTYAGGPSAPGGGTVYPRPASPGPGARRRTPPVWLVVGVAAAVLAGVVFAAVWTGTQRVAAIDTTKQPTSGAWMGRSATGAVGTPLREKAFEFTVYRVSCATAKVASQQCQATVGVRNVTPEQQTWHGQLQRAYLQGGNWVSTDEDATRLANLGRDVFAQPVAAGNRVVLPLVFTVDGMQKPKQLELRSGVFSAGVRVDVP
ncbi:hypothetical protein [Micromonospora sp. DT47]|uniref:hypothetical protein n=1 Tax=Micromonospora sp. DT47 TaxID=3393431 RepID=UPI003CF0B1C9